MDLTPDVNALVYGWKANSFEFQSLQLLSGRRFQDGQPEVMLGDLLADDLNKKPGDALETQGSPFTTVGIYHGASALEAGALIMPLDQLQQLSGMQGKVSTIHVRLRPAPAGESPDTYLNIPKHKSRPLFRGCAPSRQPSGQATTSSSGSRMPAHGVHLRSPC